MMGSVEPVYAALRNCSFFRYYHFSDDCCVPHRELFLYLLVLSLPFVFVMIFSLAPVGASLPNYSIYLFYYYSSVYYSVPPAVMSRPVDCELLSLSPVPRQRRVRTGFLLGETE